MTLPESSLLAYLINTYIVSRYSVLTSTKIGCSRRIPFWGSNWANVGTGQGGTVKSLSASHQVKSSTFQPASE